MSSLKVEQHGKLPYMDIITTYGHITLDSTPLGPFSSGDSQPVIITIYGHITLDSAPLGPFSPGDSQPVDNLDRSGFWASDPQLLAPPLGPLLGHPVEGGRRGPSGCGPYTGGEVGDE
jgi:hypothetical protein